MKRVFVMYDLQPGVSEERYEQFSRDLDQVITAHRPGVLRFEVHMVRGAYRGVAGEPASKAPFQVIETLDVASWEAWMRAVASDEMAPVRDNFARVADLDSVVMVWGDQV
jgi:hypothetical protein